MATSPNVRYQRTQGWLLYLLSLLLVVGPLSEWVVIVWPIHPGTEAWRFGSIGLLGERLTLPMVGLFIAILSATLLEQRAVQGALAGVSLLAAPILAVLGFSLALDGLQLRHTVRADVLRGFDRSLIRSTLLFLYAAVVSGVLGWTALKVRRMVGSTRRDAAPMLRGFFAPEPGA